MLLHRSKVNMMPNQDSGIPDLAAPLLVVGVGMGGIGGAADGSAVFELFNR